MRAADLRASPRCVLIADFTVSGLAPYLLAKGDPPSVECIVAPFDQVVRVLLQEDAECWSSSADVAVVWTRPESAIKSFARLLDHELVPLEAILAEVDELVDTLRGACKRVAAMFVPTWTLPAFDRGLGLLDLSFGTGPRYVLLRMNARLAEGLAHTGNAFVLDAERWVALAGPTATSPKLWHLGKIAFGPTVFQQAAADIKAGLRALAGQSRKLLALDLDDTLWGGIVGDVGWEQLALGGHDPVGESFASFQRALKTLTRRGVVLAIVSKNSESVALEAIDRHPEMILRRDDFVGWRINWDDKAANLIDLVRTINLGLDSVVFIDDSPVERARVRDALPQVLVPEWPKDKLLYEKALKELTCFDTAAISTEDRRRTAMYVADRQRTESRSQAQSLDQHLASLGLQVTCERLGPPNLQRAAQLLNKTNQMNLTTRRMTELDLQRWAESDRHSVFVFRVADRFGDYGLTGLASLALEGATARIADFVLSCRVLGRGVEQVMLHCLGEHARALGAQSLIAACRPTPRNAPCQDFFRIRSGFRSENDAIFRWSLDRPYGRPDHIELRMPLPEPAAAVSSLPPDTAAL